MLLLLLHQFLLVVLVPLLVVLLPLLVMVLRLVFVPAATDRQWPANKPPQLALVAPDAVSQAGRPPSR